MEFINQEAQLYIPDNASNGIERTTDICVAAHQDDIEIMSYGAISACYKNGGRKFTAVVATDGAGSPRIGAFEKFTDDDMKKVRIGEQKKAADIGKYAALVLLGYKSAELKNPEKQNPVQELAKVFMAAKAETVYLHNLADKHDTHVATALRAIAALRMIKDEYRPKKVYMLEVWRSLDWLCDSDKTLFDTSAYPKMALDILNVYESQIAGGKRYDLAAIGRRYANATFFESHSTDDCSSVSYGLDATDLVYSDATVTEFINRYIESFKNEVDNRLAKLSGGKI